MIGIFAWIHNNNQIRLQWNLELQTQVETL